MTKRKPIQKVWLQVLIGAMILTGGWMVDPRGWVIVWKNELLPILVQVISDFIEAIRESRREMNERMNREIEQILSSGIAQAVIADMIGMREKIDEIES